MPFFFLHSHSNFFVNKKRIYFCLQNSFKNVKNWILKYVKHYLSKNLKWVLPMKRKNMSNPNSLMDALSVRPKICKPLECLDNLKIRNTLTNRMTLRMANDIAWLFPSLLGATGAFGAITSSFSATIVAKVMK